jgi:hypothetical protein
MTNPRPIRVLRLVYFLDTLRRMPGMLARQHKLVQRAPVQVQHQCQQRRRQGRDQGKSSTQGATAACSGPCASSSRSRAASTRPASSCTASSVPASCCVSNSRRRSRRDPHSDGCGWRRRACEGGAVEAPKLADSHANPAKWLRQLHRRTDVRGNVRVGQHLHEPYELVSNFIIARIHASRFDPSIVSNFISVWVELALSVTD